MTKHCQNCGAIVKDYDDHCNMCLSRDLRYEEPKAEPQENTRRSARSRPAEIAIAIAIVLIVIGSLLGAVFVFTGQDATVTAEYTNNSDDPITMTLLLSGENKGSVLIQPGMTGSVTGTFGLDFGQRGKQGILECTFDRWSGGSPSTPFIPQIFYVNSGDHIKYNVNAGVWS